MALAIDNVATLAVVLTECVDWLACLRTWKVRSFHGVLCLLICIMLAALNTKQPFLATLCQVLGNSSLCKLSELHLVETALVCKGGITEQEVKCHLRAVSLVVGALLQPWPPCILVMCGHHLGL